MNERMEVLFGAYIGIDGGKIVYIGKKAPQEQPATIVDGTGMVAMPGIVNCHTHLAATALRSYLDDVPMREQLEQLKKQEKSLAVQIRFAENQLNNVERAWQQLLSATTEKGNDR